MPASFYLLVAISLFFALRGILGHRRLFEYPTAIALLYIAFFIPQAMAAERNPLLQAYDPWVLWLYMSLCLLMISAGFTIGKRLASRYAANHAPAPLQENRIVWGAVLLMLAGLYAIFQVRSMAFQANSQGSSWVGEITLWYLLIQAIFYAFAIACLGYMQISRRKIMLVVGVITLITIIILVGSNVKRHMIAELLIILAGTWFFIKGKQPPKIAVILAVFLGTVLLHQVGDVRKYIQEGRGSTLDAFIEGVPFQDFRYFNHDDAPEISQAVIDIYAVNQTGEYAGPSSLWNKMVHQYVPAFVFGRDFKESFKFETVEASESDYRMQTFDRTGATRTGFSDTYRSYGVLGSLIFLVIGVFMGWLFGMALNGRLWAQFYYIVLVNDGMIALTESTDRFFVSLPIVFGLTAIFVLPKMFRKRYVNRRRSARTPFRPNVSRRTVQGRPA